MLNFRTSDACTGDPATRSATETGRETTSRVRGGVAQRTPSSRGSGTGQALRFAVVGGLGAAVNMALLYLLHRWIRMPLPTASALAVELAVVHNYLLNDRWTFAVRAPSVRRFMKFNLSMLGGLGVNVLAVWSLAGIGMHFLLANGLGIGAGFAFNFAVSTAWVWRRRDR